VTTNLRGRVVVLERRQAPRRIDCTREEREAREARRALEETYARVVAAVGGEAAWREELARVWGSPPGESGPDVDAFAARYYLEPEEWRAWAERLPAVGALRAACEQWQAAAFDLHTARVLARRGNSRRE
jgi:hypothetical protein